MSARGAALEIEAPEEIREALAEFLAEHPRAQLLEGGRVLFDMAEASYTVECGGGRVLLHLWSEQRNQVRRITSATRRDHTLRLTAQRFGRTEPEPLELISERGQRRSPTARGGTRDRYVRMLHRVLEQEFPGLSVESLCATTDLEHSFGPAYARGLQVRGQTAWAVIGVGAEESPATIDGILTLGMLWLARCRERAGGRRIVEGLRLILPAGTAATTLARMAWLDSRVAKYELYELNAETESLRRRDLTDSGNVRTRLLHAPDERTIADPGGRFGAAIPRVLALLPERPRGQDEARELLSAHRRARLLPEAGDGFEMRLRSSAELTFLRHGLEFARIRMGFAGESFNRQAEVTIGSGPHETVLTDTNAPALREMVHELFSRRSAHPTIPEPAHSQRDPLFRLQPERWLESLLRADVTALDAALQPEPVYVQVPAIAGAGDRGMLDLLAVTAEQRLAVIEVKAEEDLQLAMQGLDYWIRVREHHLSHVDASTGLGDLQQHGYFPNTRLSAEAPLLYLVAPALRIHPATETVLRHFDARVPWTLVALDERWRTRIRPVWRRSNVRRSLFATV